MPSATSVARKFELFCDERSKTTGVILSLRVDVSELSSFQRCVSELWKVLREGLRNEIDWIIRASAAQLDASSVHRFSGTVDDIRHSLEHADARDAQRRFRSWLLETTQQPDLSEANEDKALQALLTQAEEALQILVGLVKRIASDRELAIEWRRFVDNESADDPVSALEIAATDLGVNLSGRQGFLSRAVENKWKHRSRYLSRSDDRSAALEHTVLQVLVSEALEPLPCRYSDLLDDFAVELGTSAAMAVLLVAQAVATHSDYESDEDFLALVAQGMNAISL